jgi:hypothetical protein
VSKKIREAMSGAPRGQLFQWKMNERDEAILAAVKARMPQLEGLLESMNSDYEEGLYRFYHQSFKVYSL